MLRVAPFLLSFCLNTKAYISATAYVVVQYINHTPVLDEVDEELSCVCLRRSTINNEYHSPVA